MTEESEVQAAPRGRRNGRLVFYHANATGTGVAARFELRLNRPGEDRYDCFFLELAHQQTPAAGSRGERGTGRFDWEKKATVKLDFADVCEFLLVLEGRREAAGNGRNGIYHQVPGANTLIAFKRSAESDGCRYLLGLSKKGGNGAEIFKGHIVLSEAEAVGLRCVLQASLFFMVFSPSLQAPPGASGDAR